ncbi:hypothetical protein QQM79_16825 [Marinobacteraceae bacterium S3BR75-40.1]
MDRPKHIPKAIWDKHLDWFNVTGETSREHLKELKSGDLVKKYRKRQQAHRLDEKGKSEAD